LARKFWMMTSWIPP